MHYLIDNVFLLNIYKIYYTNGSGDYMEYLSNIVEYATNFIQSGGILFGIFLILLESIIPALPLGVFITLNINAFGLVSGIVVSWLSTCLGCYLSFLVFRALSDLFYNKLAKNKKAMKIIKKMKDIDFSSLVVLIALPFSPAFLINIAAGIVGLSKRKFLIALLTGKIFMVVFWGCIGKSLLESVTDITTLFIVVILILVAYFLSKFISKKMKVE